MHFVPFYIIVKFFLEIQEIGREKLSQERQIQFSKKEEMKSTFFNFIITVENHNFFKNW